jgi:SAM-dependent methyltransferase
LSSIKYWGERSVKPFTGTDEDTPETAWERLQQNMLAGSVSNCEYILKTDCWNEGVRKGVFNIDLLKGKNICLVDISQSICTKALRKHPWLNVVNADIRHLPFAKEKFDAVLDISTCDHLPFYEFPKLIAEYRDVLKDNGLLLIICNKRNTLAIVAYYITSLLRRLLGKPVRPRRYLYDYEFKVKEVENILKTHFRVRISKPYGRPIIRHLAKVLDKLGWGIFYKSQLFVANKVGKYEVGEENI